MMTGAASTSLRTAVILAGGLGTRLRSEVADVPKPMAPVGGRPFLEHQMQFWIGQGISRFVLSVGYKRDVIMSQTAPPPVSYPALPHHSLLMMQ